MELRKLRSFLREKRPSDQKVREKKDFESLKSASTLASKARLSPLYKIFYIMLKNYKILIRSKVSALIFFFGPLFIIFLVSLGFNTSTLYGINVAAYSESYSPLSETIVSNLTESQFNFIKTKSELECIDNVKFNDFQACIIFPKDMVLDNSANNNIQIYVDESRINLANQITDKIASKVGVQADQLSSGIVTQILGAIDNINKEAANQKSQVTALSGNNAQAASQLGSMSSSLSGIDLTSSPIDLTSAESDLDTVDTYCNDSATPFLTNIKLELGKFKTQYTSIIAKLNTAKDSVSSIKSNADTLQTALNSDTSTLKSLSDTVNSVQGSISSLKITNVESIVSPLKTTIKPLTLKRSYFLFTFPTLLVLLIMFVGILMSAIGVVREKKSNAYFRNFITPTNDWLFLIGQYLTDISIIFAQVIIILGVASLAVTGLSLKSYLLAGLVLLVIGTIFTFIGIAIGYLFTTEESATLAAASSSILFLLFSNTILPIEALSGFLREIVTYNPFVIGESIIKRLILFESDFTVIYNMTYILLSFIVITFLIAAISRLATKRFGK